MKVIKEKSALAICEGQPLRTKPFPAWPQFAEDEIEAATRVLLSGRVNYWTGEEGRKFEQEFAEVTGCRHAIALANGTVSLELALYALGIERGDEVIVPSRTFIATATAVLMRGAIPIFADVDPSSGTITTDTIRPLLTQRTRAIIVVHVAGWPCDMDPILALARERALKVLEDCAQAHGAYYKGRPVGSLGDAGAFSFCQDKIISTGGEGGMLTTNEEEVWRRAWSYKDHGKNYEAAHHDRSEPVFRWVHEELGTNWRLTEMQSAMGRVLLHKVPDRVSRRQIHAAQLDKHFEKLPALRVVLPSTDVRHAYYKYYVYVRPEYLMDGWNRDRIMLAVCAEGIPCGVGSCSEIYREKSIPAELCPPAHLPIARGLGENSLMFQVHSSLVGEDIEDTAQAVIKVMQKAAGVHFSKSASSIPVAPAQR